MTLARLPLIVTCFIVAAFVLLAAMSTIAPEWFAKPAIANIPRILLAHGLLFLATVLSIFLIPTGRAGE